MPGQFRPLLSRFTRHDLGADVFGQGRFALVLKGLGDICPHKFLVPLAHQVVSLFLGVARSDQRRNKLARVDRSVDVPLTELAERNQPRHPPL
jgi:hypothetical protein